MGVLNLMGYIAVITNCAVLVFSANVSWMSSSHKWLIFMVAEHICVGLKMLVENFVPDIAEDVKLQVARQEFLREKLIDQEPDEMDEDEDDPHLQNSTSIEPPIIFNSDKEGKW